MADALNVSAWQISARLKKVTGRSFPQHVHDWRVRFAISKLLTCRAISRQVATAVGYARPADFCHEFRKRVGCTPKQFHRLLLAEAARVGRVNVLDLLARIRTGMSTLSESPR